MKRKLKTGILICVLCLALASCAQKENPSETTLATLGEDIISLEEAVFYTRMLQESWEHLYYGQYGEAMWQEPVSGENATLGDLLKRDVLDILTELHILAAHADAYQVELSEEEYQVITRRSKNFMDTNTPKVLEAAGATQERVEAFLQVNELASKVSAAIKDSCEPEVDEETAKVGKLTYALFAVTGTFDAQGNQTPYTEEELQTVKEQADAFAQRAQELGDISAAGQECSHTVIDVYFNAFTDGGAHPEVAEKARQMKVGEVSGIIETEEGYYIVQHVSAFEEAATAENITYMKEQAKADFAEQLLEQWISETSMELDEELWDTVKVEKMLTDPALLQP